MFGMAKLCDELNGLQSCKKRGKVELAMAAE